MSDSLTWSHHNPVRIVCAPLDTLAPHVKGQHVLLVTTPGFVKRGVAQRIQAILAPKQVTVWDGVKPNPDLRDLDAATDLLSAQGVDSVLGLGGGSALDAAKVLATTLPSAAQPTLARIFRDGESPAWANRLPLVAIPTTAGTGSEVTPFATVWDHENHKKYSLTGDFVYPDVAFLDANLTLTLDTAETLYPALDLISHALESLWNKNCTPVSRAFAFQALSLASKSLPTVQKETNNFIARSDLQTASTLAGFAISQTRTAIAHSISYPLTSHYGIPHGLACSFTLPKLLKDNIKNISNNSSETAKLIEVYNLLQGLELRKHINNYAKDVEIIKLQNEMVTVNRSGNFTGVYVLKKLIIEDNFNDIQT